MSRRPSRERIELVVGEVSLDDLKCFAREAISRFFKDKQYFCGGNVPQCELIGDFATKTVLRSRFDERCFEFIHEKCLPLIPKDPKYNDPSLTWTVHCLLELLASMRAREVPIDFQPGMLLLWFQFCMGVDIPRPL